jgi:hypothetical protein
VPIGFIAQVGHTIQPFIAHQRGNSLDQGGLVGHIRQLGDDDAVASAAHLLQVGARLESHLAPPGGVSGDQRIAILLDNDTTGRKIRALDKAH